MKTNIPYNSLIWGICAIVVGLLLLFNPIDAINLAVRLLGLLSLTIGLIQLIVQLIQNRKAEQKSIPFGGIILSVWGALLLIRPELWADFFMLLIGLTMAFLSINLLVTYRRVNKSGINVNWAYYVFPTLMLISGITTILNPDFLKSWLVIFVAIWILAYGVVELISYFSLKE